jgi:hypothetical protein
MIANQNMLRFFQAWAEAALALGVEVRLNYYSPQLERPVAIFLPHFGGPQGMVIEPILPPHFEKDSALAGSAKEVGLFCSFMNANEYAVFDSPRFIEALSDWGYFGKEAKPAWMTA